MLALINPVERAEPFDHDDWLFETKFNVFRALAGTVPGRPRATATGCSPWRRALGPLPKGHGFDGELVVPDGRELDCGH
jgi:hypothetical protein